jgi:hypothetical protein
MCFAPDNKNITHFQNQRYIGIFYVAVYTRERERERERERNRIKAQAIIFLNRPGQMKKSVKYLLKRAV